MFKIFYIESTFLTKTIADVVVFNFVYAVPQKVCKALPLQSGKTAIVTGGAAGIGFHITKHLVSLGARVIIASRSRKQAESAIARIRENHPDAEVEFMFLDLASFDSVRKFADDFFSKDWALHILINNAGVMLVPCKNTEDGFEYHLQVNFLSHALLTTLLLDKMESSAAIGNTVVSVVNVSSVAHEAANFRNKIFEGCEDNWSYSSHNAYAVSKLAIVMYTYALSRKLAVRNSPVTVNAVHPGIVDTNLYCHVHPPISWALGILKNFLFMSPQNASKALLHVALSPDLNKYSGFYFSNCQQKASSSLSYSLSLQEYIYNRTCKIINKKRD
ncbi:dehydrogenase/reductase SDR family member on chromosome X-like [Pomacea canaliculata]|uniref:dehydrogenase/reductase SDR family member on chromosome X-like n=1 Tax=Pomacea canaliculata TaxID=400727 RepID=UPI000D73663B|nr:dehydrogenase/reductase SDR family member on chromosome X-like [Pomacea canaliculata]